MKTYYASSLVVATMISSASLDVRAAADDSRPSRSYQAVLLGTELGSSRVSLIRHATDGEILRFRVRGSDDALPTVLKIGTDEVVERRAMTAKDIRRLRDLLLDPDTYASLESPKPLRDNEGSSSIILGGSSNRIAVRIWYRDHPTVLEVTYQLMGRITFEECERTPRGRVDRATDHELLLNNDGLGRLTAFASSLLVGVVDADTVERAPGVGE